MKKKLFVVSDLHGYYTEFRAALDASGYDSADSDHIIVFCGDLFDRGCENMKVLQFFERTERCVMIRGNHEDMLLDVFRQGRLYDHNFHNGTAVTINEFFGKYAIYGPDNSIDFSGKTRTLDRITDMIMQMRDYFETQNYIFVHGWLPNELGVIRNDWKSASEKDWENARFTAWTQAYSGVAPIKDKTLVCGHMSAAYGKWFDFGREPGDYSPFFGNGVIAIDACTFLSRKVNIVVLEDELLPAQ